MYTLYFIDVQYSFIDRGILNRLICFARFSNNFNSAFCEKRFMKLVGALQYNMPREKNRLDI